MLTTKELDSEISKSNKISPTTIQKIIRDNGIIDETTNRIIFAVDILLENMNLNSKNDPSFKKSKITCSKLIIGKEDEQKEKMINILVFSLINSTNYEQFINIFNFLFITSFNFMQIILGHNGMNINNIFQLYPHIKDDIINELILEYGEDYEENIKKYFNNIGELFPEILEIRKLPKGFDKKILELIYNKLTIILKIF